MLDEVSPEQFDEWLAYYRLEPFGDEWLQAGTVASAAHNAGLLAASGHVLQISESAFLPPEKFIPSVELADKPPISSLEMEHALRMMFP